MVHSSRSMGTGIAVLGYQPTRHGCHGLALGWLLLQAQWPWLRTLWSVWKARFGKLRAVPWKELKLVDQREEFVRAYLRGAASMSQLCREHNIARKTGYKWVQRLLDGGVPALMDRSRAPLTHPNAVADEVIDVIVELRKQRPTWGPKKLRARLYRDQPKVAWPSEGTFARILRRHGLAQSKRRMRRTPASEHRLAVPREPNDVWCADYKGKFRVDRKYCHPLTISDACSRFLLCCQDTGGERQEPTQLTFEKAFKEFGLPLRIRTDNGVPFASTSLGGLSKLSLWWVKLGILPERTRPAHPQDNGQHERMHRTLKADTAKPPRSSLARQQQCFDVWRQDFNYQRPHEALDMRVPADVYTPSPRVMPDKVPDPEYPAHFEICRVYNNGHTRFDHHRLGVGRVLAGEVIGFEPIDDAIWQVWFGPIYLGLFTDLGSGKFTLHPNRPYKRSSK